MSEFCDVNMSLVNGIWIKEMRFQKGWIAVTHSHTFDHQTLLPIGKMKVTVDDKVFYYTAPAILVIEAGKHHQLEALEDNTVAYCIHRLDEQDTLVQGIDNDALTQLAQEDIMPAMMAVLAGGGLAAGGSVISGLFGASAAKKQAKATKYAANKAQETAYEIDRRQRADIAPFREYGVQAGNTLMGMLTGGQDTSQTLQESDLYKFQSQLGTRDINRQLAARGMQHSGAGLETLQRFTNQLVADEGQRYYDRLYNLTALGSNAAAHTATNTTNIGANLMGVQGQLGTQYANAVGAEQSAYGSAVGGTLSAFGNSVAQYPLYSASMQYLNRGNQPTLAGMQPSGNQPYTGGNQIIADLGLFG